MQLHKRILLLSLFSILAVGVTVRAQFKPTGPRESRAPARRGDYWLKTERKGTAFAYRRMLTRRGEGGIWTYYATDRRQTDVAGHDSQEVLTKGTYVVDSLFNVISFEFLERSKARDMDMKGVCSDGVMTITVSDKAGFERSVEVSCDNVTFESAIPDIVLEQAGDKPVTVGVFDPETFAVSTVEIEVTKAGDSLVVARVTSGLLAADYVINRKRGLMEISCDALGIVSRRTTSSDAHTIVSLRTDDGMTLTVKADKPFPNVYTVEKARVRVGWKNVPFGMFQFADNRQRVLEADTIGAARNVVLELTAVGEPVGGVTVPVTDESFRPYLGSDEFILPGDPEVAALARTIRGGSSDGLQVVQQILEWIKANISTKYILSTLSAPEVLHSKSGKCSEYAILFASLARSAGVPTKIVLGESYSGDSWVGHMYNEVWLGEWVAVDPTAGTFVSGPSHIKLTESATVTGTQQVRMGLVDNLSIEIIDFAEKGSKPTGQIKTGVIDGSYQNAQYGCRISCPEGAWRMEAVEKGGRVTVTMKPSGSDAVKVDMTLFAIPPGTVASAVLDGRLNVLAQMVDGFELLSRDDTTLAGRVVSRAVFQSDYIEENQPSVRLRSENYVLVDGANGYLLKYTAPADGPELLLADCRGILGSFELLQ